MAKEGLLWDLGYEPYCRRDPVSGATKCYVRVRHNQVRSPTLKAFDACVAQQLQGRRYRGQGAEADEAAVRAALREAARACSSHATVPAGRAHRSKG
jgi:hypothetical protein